MIEIRELHTDEDSSTFRQLINLLEQMYEYMNSAGLNIQLSENGSESFVDAIKKTLGKLNYVSAAFENGIMIGFGIATIRIAPPYLGNLKMGAVSHIYVVPEKRKTDIGKKILFQLENWCTEKQVHSIELEVLWNNASGIRFWKNNGYSEELIKMRKIK